MYIPMVSALLPTYNCAETLRSTLASIRWADDILVVDSFSTDSTLEICREYGARIVQHEYVNSATQKNWAIGQCLHEWVLQIDSDEILEPGVEAVVRQAVAAAPPDVHAFRLPRRNHVLGRWMRYGGNYPDYQIRLLRRDAGKWSGREVHAHVQVPGMVVTLGAGIDHHGMECISRQLRNLDRYTRYEADELRKQARRFRLFDLLMRPGAAFVYRYLWLQGFRDGWRGFIVCAHHAIYTFLARAKLWETEELGISRSPR